MSAGDVAERVAESVATEVARSLISMAVDKLGGNVAHARELLSQEEIRLANLAADAIERERFGVQAAGLP